MLPCGSKFGPAARRLRHPNLRRLQAVFLLQLPPVRAAATVMAAKENRAWFAGDLKCVIPGQIAGDPLVHGSVLVVVPGKAS